MQLFRAESALQVAQTQTELGNDWYLDKVEVTGPEGVCWVFPCDDWFGRTEDDESVGRICSPLAGHWSTLVLLHAASGKSCLTITQRSHAGMVRAVFCWNLRDNGKCAMAITCDCRGDAADNPGPEGKNTSRTPGEAPQAERFRCCVPSSREGGSQQQAPCLTICF